MSDGMVAALLEERRGYLLHGRHDRVQQVDIELAKFNLVAADEPAPDELETTDGAPSKRRGRPPKSETR